MAEAKLFFKGEKPGQHLVEFAPKPIDAANKTGEEVIVEFNEITIPVNPGDTAEVVVDNYLALLIR